MSFKIAENNIPEVKRALAEAVEDALTKIGVRVHEYATKKVPVGTPESTGIPGYIGGTLKNSLAYKVGEVDGVAAVTVGSNVEYAP